MNFLFSDPDLQGKFFHEASQLLSHVATFQLLSGTALFHCGENFLNSLWRCFCFLFRRSYSDLCRNRELFLSSDCSQSCHFPDSDVPGQREDEDRAAHGGQCAREPHRLWEHRHLEREDPQDPARDAVHPGLLHYPRALLLSRECGAGVWGAGVHCSLAVSAERGCEARGVHCPLAVSAELGAWGVGLEPGPVLCRCWRGSFYVTVATGCEIEGRPLFFHQKLAPWGV